MESELLLVFFLKFPRKGSWVREPEQGKKGGRISEMPLQINLQINFNILKQHAVIMGR